KKYPQVITMLDSTPLYPDQLVYLKGLSFEDSNSNIYIDTAAKEIRYTGKVSEAQAIEETILGVIYTLKSIIERKMTVKPMPDEGVVYILGWESEKYRRSVVSG
ncbi:MAG TPA: hypothetical protein PLZ84_07910, partial [Clostridia bacterium]|nr:hypothetical protein [Clostridia bacterium]